MVGLDDVRVNAGGRTLSSAAVTRSNTPAPAPAVSHGQRNSCATTTSNRYGSPKRRSAAKSRRTEVEQPEVGLRHVHSAQRVGDQDVQHAIDRQHRLLDRLERPQCAGGADQPAAVGVVGFRLTAAGVRQRWSR